MRLLPTWRNRLFAAVAALIAVWLGFDIAQGDFFLPATLATGLLLFLLARWQPLPLGTVLLGFALFGYVVGNRGFAQVMISPRFPLLPAEGILLVTGALLLVQSAWRHELPFRRDPLNLLILAWLAAGAVRIVFDYRTYGIMAVRDFATVYYALFFYVSQDASRNPVHARALRRILLVTSLGLLVVYAAYEQFPGFFLGTLTLRGMPLIYYKGDLAGTFLAVGAVLWFLRFEARGRWWNLALSLILATAVVATNNRASLLGLLVAAGWLALGRRWRFAAILGGSGAAAALVILMVATVMNTSWEKTPLFGLYERAVSIVDPTGKRVYRGEATFNKGDNNLFRTVWWGAVIDETVEENPYVGMGFGRDLAARFVREYYPETGEEFSVRSPHNILLTLFARMGAIGLGLFLAIMVAISGRTWRAIHAGPSEAAPWCAVWVIFTSACFGVVLEGPMGAVVFWIVLGIANAAVNPGPEVPVEPTKEQAISVSQDVRSTAP